MLRIIVTNLTPNVNLLLIFFDRIVYDEYI